MFNKMIFSLYLLAMSIGYASHAHAYTYSVANDFPDPIYTEVTYFVCNNAGFYLKPGEMTTYHRGACCLKGFSWHSRNPSCRGSCGGAKNFPVARCRNRHFRINPDGTLKIR